VFFFFFFEGIATEALIIYDREKVPEQNVAATTNFLLSENIQ